MNLLNDVQGMDTKDCRLYRQLLENLNIFLGVKRLHPSAEYPGRFGEERPPGVDPDNWKTRRNLNVGSGGNKQ
ncbi:hypothetical protein NXW50_30865 [Bacteroides thetaiotaomicron]|nr:hypothetical protein [Bacteroides thetaiotaomicron]MCS2282369.1 hypothetical protein [Bacteroides thetaiotaomicron]